MGSVICGGDDDDGGGGGVGSSSSLLRGKINTQLAKQLRNRLELYPPLSAGNMNIFQEL